MSHGHAHSDWRCPRGPAPQRHQSRCRPRRSVTTTSQSHRSGQLLPVELLDDASGVTTERKKNKRTKREVTPNTSRTTPVTTPMLHIGTPPTESLTQRHRHHPWASPTFHACFYTLHTCPDLATDATPSASRSGDGDSASRDKAPVLRWSGWLGMDRDYGGLKGAEGDGC